MVLVEIKHIIGNNICLLRQRLGLTQEDVALGCDMGVSHYRAVEKGTGNPTVKTLHKISEALQVSFDDIVLLKTRNIVQIDEASQRIYISFNATEGVYLYRNGVFQRNAHASQRCSRCGELPCPFWKILCDWACADGYARGSGDGKR